MEICYCSQPMFLPLSMEFNTFGTDAAGGYNSHGNSTTNGSSYPSHGYNNSSFPSDGYNNTCVDCYQGVFDERV